MTPTLRGYQEQAIDGLVSRIRAGARRLVLVAPTGAGKTVMFSAMVARAVAKGKRALVLVHRRELVEQAHEKLSAAGLDAGVILAGVREQRRLPVQVASIQTIGRHDPSTWPPADLVIVDEAHHACSPSWRRMLEHYSEAIIIGATATPWRTDKQGLLDIFEDYVLAATVSELIGNGSLSPFDVYAYDSPELHEVPLVAGEFNQQALSLACNTRVLVGNTVERFREYHNGRRALLFAVSIDHSRALVDELRVHHIRAEHIDGKTDKLERKRIVQQLAAGEIQVLSSVGCFTEGFDSPAVEICMLARPTMSLTLHLQMCGRGLRPAPGKQRALLVDHGGNFLRHGLPDDERDYSLTATPKRVAEMHRCPLCCAVFGQLSDEGACPKCDQIIAPPREEREAAARREKERVEGEAIEAERIRELRKAFLANAPEQKKRKYYEKLIGEAKAKGYKPGWVAHRFKVVYGHYPSFGKRQPALEELRQARVERECLCHLGHPPCSYCTDGKRAEA